MRIMKIWSDTPSQGQLTEIKDLLESGEIIIYPTDTLYAYACDALNPKAVDALCRLKGINPAKNNLSIVCDSISQAAEYARIDNQAFKLMREYMPGPYVFIFRALNSLPKAFKGRKNVGIRIPDSSTARGIVSELGHPLLTTSVSLDDEDYMRNPELMAEALDGTASLLVDAGEGGTEPATIVDFTLPTPEITRQGKAEIQL